MAGCFPPYEWARGVMINTNESTHGWNEMTVYFYQMCGRRARDNLTLSRGNVSSCVCGCNKTSCRIPPRSVSWLRAAGFLFFFPRRTSKVKNNRDFKARRVELCNTFSASFLFPAVQTWWSGFTRWTSEFTVDEQTNSEACARRFTRHCGLQILYSATRTSASPINYLLRGRINTRDKMRVSEAWLADWLFDCLTALQQIRHRVQHCWRAAPKMWLNLFMASDHSFTTSGRTNGRKSTINWVPFTQTETYRLKLTADLTTGFHTAFHKATFTVSYRKTSACFCDIFCTLAVFTAVVRAF